MQMFSVSVFVFLISNPPCVENPARFDYQSKHPRKNPDLSVPKFEVQETENDSIFERDYDSFKPEDFKQYK